MTQPPYQQPPFDPVLELVELQKRFSDNIHQAFQEAGAHLNRVEQQMVQFHQEQMRAQKRSTRLLRSEIQRGLWASLLAALFSAGSAYVSAQAYKTVRRTGAKVNRLTRDGVSMDPAALQPLHAGIAETQSLVRKHDTRMTQILSTAVQGTPRRDAAPLH